jgi:hypothetical protein
MASPKAVACDKLKMCIDQHIDPASDACSVNAAESPRVDDVPVMGELHDLSVADIHDAIVAFAPEGKGKPSEIEVISDSEIRAYFELRDLGWVSMHRVWVHQPTATVLRWLIMGRSTWDNPEALRVMRSAEEVYVFPVATPLAPHRDDAHMRLLDKEARESLERLLGDERNWCHCGWSFALFDPPSDVGFLFRQSGTEVVLFPLNEGTFNGEFTKGLFDQREALKLWKQQYAEPELSVY